MTETCNGVDDNCNGAIDEGCACIPFDITLPFSGATSVALAWLGTGYLAVFNTVMSVLVVAIGADGSVGAPVALAPVGQCSSALGLAWNGSSLAVVCADVTTELRVIVVEQGPVVLGPEADLGIGAAGRPITWTGDRFGVAYTAQSSPAQSFLQELGSDGRTTSGRLSLGISAQIWTIAPADAGYMLASNDLIQNSPIRASLVDHSGAVVASNELGTPTPSVRFGFQIVRGSGGFGALWQDANVVYFQVLDPSGGPAAPIATLPGYEFATVAALSNGYEVVGFTLPGPEFIDFDGGGAIVAGPSRLLVSDYQNSVASLVTADHRETLAYLLLDTRVRVVQACR